MTKEELEQLKQLLQKADKTATRKHLKAFYEDRDITDTENTYALFASIMELKIKLDIGIYDEYLLNKTEQKQ